MKTCNHCGASIDDDAQFCTTCGKKVEMERHCIHCGAVIDADSVFCTSCGRRQDGSQSSPNTLYVAPPQPVTLATPQPGNYGQTATGNGDAEKRQQYIIIACIVLAVLLCAGGWLAYQKFYNTTESEDMEEATSYRSITLYGAVDKYPITMQLDIEGSVVKGTYYYNRQGPDKFLTLSGILNDGEMDIYESDENGRQTGHFKGRYHNGEFQGEFVTMQGKSMYFHVTE